MRCDQCNLFVAFETPEPESESFEATDNENGTGTLTGQYRVHRDCEQCSQELKEYTFDVEEQFDCPKNCGSEGKAEEGEHHDFTVDGEDNAEITESGGHRYKKNMIGFSVDITVSCSNCDFCEELHIEDSAAASWFEELI